MWKFRYFSVTNFHTSYQKEKSLYVFHFTVGKIVISKIVFFFFWGGEQAKPPTAELMGDLRVDAQ